MVYKKYIKRGEKLYGPYLYHNVKRDGRVITTYHGKHHENNFRRNITNLFGTSKKPSRNFLFVAGFLTFLILVLSVNLLFLLNLNLTGKTTVDIQVVYKEGESIKGDVKLILKHGELFPADSRLIVDNAGSVNEFDLRNLVSQELITGDFYVENKEINESGEGYGVLGQKVIYPSVTFSYRIIDEGIISGGGIGEIVASNETETNETDETSGNETIIEESPTEPEPNETVVESPPETPSETPTEEITTESQENVPAEESGVTTETTPSETGSEATSDGSSEQASSQESTPEPGITGGVIGDEENLTDMETSFLEPFTLELESGKTIEIVFSEHPVNFKKEGNTVTVTTNYSEIEEGFGKDYLTEETLVIPISLSDLGILAQDGDLRVSFVYMGEELTSATKAITVEKLKEILNETILEQNITGVNVTIVNVTNVTGDIQFPAVIGQPVKWKKIIKPDKKGEFRVKVPKEAEVTKVNVESEELIEDESTFWQPAIGSVNETNVTNGTIIPSDEGEFGVSVSVNESSGNETEPNITEPNETSSEFTIPGISGGAVTDVLITEEQENFKEVVINAEFVEYSIEYETPAPYAIESDVENGKLVKIIGPETIHYENVLAFTQLPENLNIKSPGSVTIFWQEQNIFVPAQNVLDQDSNGIYDYVEWVVPQLSNQTFEIIVIKKAEHLDSNKIFISDIYNEVKELDGVWSETIPNGDYVRVTFEINLTNENDITIYPRTVNGTPRIEVYEVDGNDLIAKFESLNDNEYNKILLTNLISESQDVFDLRVVNGNIEFEHIVDPLVPKGEFFEDCISLTDWNRFDTWAPDSNQRCATVSQGGDGKIMSDGPINLSDPKISYANLSFEINNSGEFALEGGLHVQISNDSGVNWVNIVQDSSNTFNIYDINISSFIKLTANMHIQAKCIGAGGGKICRWDNINLTSYKPHCANGFCEFDDAHVGADLRICEIDCFGSFDSNLGLIIKWDISELCNLNQPIDGANLSFYIKIKSGSPDNDARVWYISNQTWTESTSASEIDGFTKTIQTDTTLSSTTSGTRTNISVTSQVEEACNNGNNYVTFMVQDPDYPFSSIGQVADINLITGFLSEFFPVYFLFSDSENTITAERPKLFVNYLTTDIPPRWSQNSTNGSRIGSSVEHRVQWKDGHGLSGYIFSFDNGTGTFVNDSFVAMIGKTNWSNVTKVVSSTYGSTIRWRVYANDSINQWNATDIFTYTTTVCGEDTNWVVNYPCSINNVNLALNKNLTLQSGGNLTFNNVKLRVNSSFNGQYGLRVESGGEFNILNGSNITYQDINYSYFFIVNSGSVFNMKDSYLSGTGWANTLNQRGLEISTTVNFTNNTLTNSYIGVSFYNSNNRIINNTIEKMVKKGVYIEGGNNNIFTYNRLKDAGNHDYKSTNITCGPNALWFDYPGTNEGTMQLDIFKSHGNEISHNIFNDTNQSMPTYTNPLDQACAKTRYGLNIENSSFDKIDNNTMHMIGTWVIRIDRHSTNINITNTDIKGTHGDGIITNGGSPHVNVSNIKIINFTVNGSEFCMFPSINTSNLEIRNVACHNSVVLQGSAFKIVGVINATIDNVTITTSLNGIGVAGVQEGGPKAQNIVISNFTINTTGGVYVGGAFTFDHLGSANTTGTSNITFYNGVVYGAQGSIIPHLTSTLSNESTATFINVTFNKSNTNIQNGTFYVGWYLDANVTDNSTSLPIINANVSAWDKNNNFIFSELTASNGFIPRKDVIEYLENSSGKFYIYNNYTINTTKFGYQNDSKSVNITGNTLLNISLIKHPSPYNINLISPLNNSLFGVGNISFSCNATDANGLANITLLSNFNTSNTNFLEYNQNENMTVWYHFNNDSAFGENNALIYDFSGKGNHITQFNGNVVPTASGRISGGYRFENTSTALSYALIPFPGANNSTNISKYEAVSVALWANLRSLSTNAKMIGTTANSFTLFVDTNKKLVLWTYLTDGKGVGGWDFTGEVNLDNLGIEPLNQWHHYAFSYNTKTNTTRMYVDGNLYNTVNGSFRNGTMLQGPIGNGFTIGTENGQNFNGTIDELALFNRELTATEVKQMYLAKIQTNSVTGTQNQTTFNINSIPEGTHDWSCKAENIYDLSNISTEVRIFTVDSTPPFISFVPPTPLNNSRVNTNWTIVNVSINDSISPKNLTALIDWNRSLVGWWRFNENTGQFANDSSTWGNNGTLGASSGSASNDPNWTNTGKFGNALEFDGVDDFVNITEDLSWDLVGKLITIEAWINPRADNQGDKGIVAKWPNSQGYMLYIVGGAKPRFYINSNFSEGTTTFTKDNWYLLTGVWNMTHSLMYVNGKLEGIALASNITTNPRITEIGTYNDRLQSVFNGTIDEVRVWGRALSEQEINASYNIGLYRLFSNFTNLSLGSYTFRAYTQDLAGNVNQTELRTIRVNVLPTVTLISPADNATTTSRTPTFTWQGNDAEGDFLVYEFNITRDGGSDLCIDSRGNVVVGSVTFYTIDPYLKCLIDNGDYYNWTVRASDDIGVNWGPWATPRRINIQALISINLLNDSVNFGLMVPGQTNDTTDNSPRPLLIENNGTVFVNVTMNATNLFISSPNPTNFFRYKVDNSSEVPSFNWLLSQTGWRNVPNSTSSDPIIALFNFTDATDTAEIDINVTAPDGEVAGTKSSLITFEAKLAE